MNEAETRAELIDPWLKACGWGVVEGSKILREHYITKGKIKIGGGRDKQLKADYVLMYKGVKLAVVEAKSDEEEVEEGVAQAKNYAELMALETTYSSNGKEIYSICMKTGAEGPVPNYLTPQELWQKTFGAQNQWRDKFNAIPFEDIGGTKKPYYYQEVAVNSTLQAIADGKNRILLTLATGTGKTTIAFHIVWKLFKARWNLKLDGARQPRILFLTDRNILADQAKNEFTAYSAFSDDALRRIKPDEIRKEGWVTTNGSIFFTIFQTFMSGPNETPYFGEYPNDYFDMIIIDECHRGGAKDEGTWRGILEYFSPAVQLGLTATPKRDKNIDTYKYFGEPVYIYSLKRGINEGFLTPFKVRRIQTTIDEYIYTPDDEVIEGEVERGKIYVEEDFNKIIEIKAREAKRVQLFMDEINQDEKAIVFCRTQAHAAAVRDLINQYKKSKATNYCVRVTANDGALGEEHLEVFKDNDNTLPTILTTSYKLSTGVDAKNIRAIILMRPIKNIIEFKQIIGRGTRLYQGKDYFTIYDFVNAYQNFLDPEWDGEPIEPIAKAPKPYTPPSPVLPEAKEGDGEYQNKKLKIKLADGKEREIQHMISTSFWSADGVPIPAAEFLNKLFGELPGFFKSEEELRLLWSNPLTRKTLLEKLEAAGYGTGELKTLQSLINAEKSDLFDVLEYVFNSDIKPITREARVAKAHSAIIAVLSPQQKEFIEFVLSKYIESGVEELDQDRLPRLLTLKYHSLPDATNILGEVDTIRNTFIEFQKHLYQQKVA